MNFEFDRVVKSEENFISFSIDRKLVINETSETTYLGKWFPLLRYCFPGQRIFLSFSELKFRIEGEKKTVYEIDYSDSQAITVRVKLFVDNNGYENYDDNKDYVNYEYSFSREKM